MAPARLYTATVSPRKRTRGRGLITGRGMPPKLPQPPPPGRRLAFALLVLLGALGAAEGVARLGGARLFPQRRALDALPGEAVPGEPNMVVDPVTGWRPRTGAQKSFGIPGGTSVNSRGLRGPEYPIPKPTRKRRVMFLGDSTVFGVMVADAAIFPRKVEASLQAIDPNVEVLDGGAPGWSSYQAKRALNARLLAYEPDLLVIATLWSDTQMGELADSVRFRPLLPFLGGSTAYLLTREWLNQLRYGNQTESVTVDLLPPDQHMPPPGRPAVQAGPKLPPPGPMVLRVPLNDYRRNLAEMAEIMHDRGGDVAFLVLPCKKDPGAGKVGDFRDDFRAAMREVAGSLSAPLADAPPAFAQAPTSEFFDDVHPTPAGHARLAEVVTAALSPWARGERR